MGDPLSPASRSSGASPWRTTAAAVVATGAGFLPSLMLAALAVQVRGDGIMLTTFRLGVALSVFFLVSAIGSLPAGWVIDRIGARRGIWLTGVTSGLPMLGMGLVVQTWAQLLAVMGVAGLGNALAQPAANLALLRGVPVPRQGLAFGIKQSAIPAGAFLSGLAVPTVALTVGWQWAFIGAAVLTLTSCLALPPHSAAAAPTSPPAARRGRARWSIGLVGLAVAAWFGAMGVNSLSGFFIESSTARGIDEALAGYLLAAGGLLGVASRFAAGLLADRRPGRLLSDTVVMIFLSVPAFVVIALGGADVGWLVVATMIGFTVGVAWNGPFNLAVVRSHPGAPGFATGVTQAGLWGGATVGPLAFGAVAEASYVVAWLLSGAFVALAGVSVVVARRSLERAGSAVTGVRG